MSFRIVFVIFTTSSLLMAQHRSLHLDIGDPDRKGREAPVVLDAVTDSATGELLTPSDLARRLGDTGLLFIGESHTSMGFHLVQLRVLQELHKRGKKLLIGLEMYPYTEQVHLDRWTDGLLTEEGFLALSGWYKNWGYHWDYYRDIFLFAREHRIRIFAVNAPREVVSAVRKRGFQNLTAEEAAHIPPSIDTDSEEHLALFRSYFEESEGMHSSMSEGQVKSMFEAQCTWDATMAYNAAQALKKFEGRDTLMVVLAGSGHVAYGLGIQRQAARWFSGTMASVIPIAVVDEKNRPIETVGASYADFVWGIPAEKYPLYPDLGVATTEIPGTGRRRVLSVEKDTVAERGGFQTGDVLISMDGIPIQDREILNRLMSEKRWGDGAAFVVDRDGAEVVLDILFRRKEP